MTKDANMQVSLTSKRVESERQPFVISITPCKKYEIVFGKRFKIGAKHSITMKNIVIMQPTERMESVEFNTMSERLVFVSALADAFFFSSPLTLRRRYKMPFKIAPKTWLKNKIYPTLMFLNIPIPTAPIINIGPDVEQNADILKASSREICP